MLQSSNVLPASCARHQAGILAVLSGLVLTGSCGAAVVADADFSLAAWSLTQFAGGAGSTTASQVVGGGAQGIGNARQIQNVVPPSTLIWSVSLFEAEVIDPSSVGGISNLQLSLDARILSGSSALVGLALRQAGVVYRSNGETLASQGSWQQFTLSASTFARLSGAGPAAPDFSSSGSALTVGFYVANSTLAGATTYSSEYSNFAVNFAAVPAPGLIPMFAVVFAARLSRRRVDSPVAQGGCVGRN